MRIAVNYKEPIVTADYEHYICAECKQVTDDIIFIDGKGWVCLECYGSCRSCQIKGAGNE